MRRLLLTDRSAETLKLLLPVLQEHYDVRACNSGSELLDELLAFRPELMVFDLTMPDCDPPGLLRIAQALDICPRVLATSCSITDTVNRMLTAGTITYLLIQPFDTEALLKRLFEMEHLLNANRTERLYMLSGSIMQELGLRYSQSGFRYLTEAALYLFDHEDCLFTDELYPHVAKVCNSSVPAVEKAISRCISTAWSRKNTPVWLYYFENLDHCPTNVRFLKALIAAMEKAF